MIKMWNFKQKTIIITGAANGIGRAIANYMAQCGAKIISLDINQKNNMQMVEELKSKGYSALAFEVDLTNENETRASIQSILRQEKKLTTLIHNAGATIGETFEMVDSTTWHTEIALNLNAAYYCIDSILPIMKKQKAGEIILISSVNGLVYYGNPAYSAAKAGLINLTRSIAAEYGHLNIRINAVCPGSVQTQAWQHRLDKNPALMQKILKHYPLGKLTQPKDIAFACAFLISDMASSITGTAIPVDCGLSVGNLTIAKEITLQD